MKTALTIGFFDGVHLGHQALLKRLRTFPHTTIITFSNHPKSILAPPAPKLILPLDEKIKLLKAYADELLVLPFTAELASTPYDAFLAPFALSHLLLGEGDALGKGREGTPANLQALGQKRNFTLEYLPKIFLDNEPISSSRVRKAIETQNHLLIERLLGRNL